MYDKHLDTFIQTADSGSFLKASEKMFISANAITKQISLLEERLEVKLFHRSPQGLALTEAGQLIYSEAKKMIRHSDMVLRKAKELGAPRQFTIRIGVSLMNPANLLLEQWGRAAAGHPGIRLEIVPFEDTVEAFREVLDHLGQVIDVISCPYETNFWGDRYQSFHLKDLPLCVACSRSHPLASRDRLTVRDLYGQTLWMAERGGRGLPGPGAGGSGEKPPGRPHQGSDVSEHRRVQRAGGVPGPGSLRPVLERGTPPAGHHPRGVGAHPALRPDLRKKSPPGGHALHHGGGPDQRDCVTAGKAPPPAGLFCAFGICGRGAAASAAAARSSPMRS